MTAPVLLTPKQIIVTTGGAYILITSTPGATLTCGADSYTLGSAETSHAFEVEAGTYACSAVLSGYTTATLNVTVTSGLTEITLKPYLLPAEYQQVEWVKTDGVAEIYDSALGLPSGYKIELYAYVDYVDARNQTNGQFWFGTNNYMQIALYTGHISVGNANVTYNWALPNNYKFSIIGNVLYINDTSTGLTRNVNTSGNYLYSNGSSGYSKGGAYSRIVKTDSSNNTVLDWVACYKKTDFTPGFYDVINNSFISQTSSAGNLICGEDIN